VTATDHAGAVAGRRGARRHRATAPARDGPGQPRGTREAETAAPDVPPGWTTNPSAWSRRLPLVGLALVGFCIAAYLAAYQVGILPSVWEPFFGTGSRTVLTSWVSRALPVPDAALGALAYLCEAAAGLLGGRARWRTHPWLVMLYGAIVGLLGIASVVLAIAQPVAFGAWCTLCLASAAISLTLVGPALEEVLASLQYVNRVSVAGGPAWGAFWGLAEARAPAPSPDRPAHRPPGRPGWWPQVAATALGLWLMAAPAVLGFGGLAAVNAHVVGPLVVACAWSAVWPAARPLRWGYGLLGLWLLVAPWLLSSPPAALANSMVVGALLALLAWRSAPASEGLGGGWLALLHDGLGADAPAAVGEEPRAASRREPA